MALWETVLQIVILILALRALHMVTANNSCSEVRRNFFARVGPAKVIVPYVAREAKDLRVCPNFQLSCCNRQMESRFQSQSKRDLKTSLTMKTSSLKFNFRSFADKYQDDVVDTFSFYGNRTRDDVKRALRKKIESHRVKASLQEVDRLFQSLGLRSTGEDVKTAFDRFADKLFLFFVDDEHNVSQPDMTYQRCVSERRIELHPFMDVPATSATNLTTAIELARILHEGLVAGAVAVNVTEDARFSKSCQEALFKMQYCSYCPGLTLLKPCVGLCKNVLRGCFAGVTELDHYWNYYISALVDVTERMRSAESKYNLEIALEDFQNKLSSSLSVILENITTLRDTVEHQCKNTRTLKRSKRSRDPLTESDSDEQNNRLSERARARNGGRRRLRGGRRKGGRSSQYEDMLEGFDTALKGLEEEDPDEETPPARRPHVRPPHEILLQPSKRIWPRKAGDKNIVESKKASSQLHKRIGRFVDTLNSSVNFYRHLPDNMCGGQAGLGIEVSRENNCWEGTQMVAQYEKEVVPSGYGKQASNPEVKVLKVDREIIQAIERLRETTKVFLTAAGKTEVPGILLHAPVYERREDEQNLPKGVAPKFPCDDEDDCGKGEGSGGDKEFDPDADAGDPKNSENVPEADIKIILDQEHRSKVIEPTDPTNGDVFIDVSVKEDKVETREEKCKGGRRKCGGRRNGPKKNERVQTPPTTPTTTSTTSSAAAIFKFNLMAWLIPILFSRLSVNVFIPN